MITKALYDYLTSTEPITGYPSNPFRVAQVVGPHTLVDREDARRQFRSRVGDEIYWAKRPRQGSKTTAVTLRMVTQNAEPEVRGGSTLADSIVQCDVWTKGKDAALRADVTGTLLRLCCEGFGGSYWGEVSIGDCVAVRAAQFVEQATTGDDWTHRYSIDLQVFWHQASAVV